MLQQSVSRLESRDIRGVADPFASWRRWPTAIARMPAARAEARPAGRIFERDRRLGDEPEPFERKLIGVGGRLASRHVFFANDRSNDSVRPAAARTAWIFSRQVPETTARRARP